jgi:hypothetical protein
MPSAITLAQEFEQPSTNEARATKRGQRSAGNERGQRNASRAADSAAAVATELATRT